MYKNTLQYLFHYNERKCAFHNIQLSDLCAIIQVVVKFDLQVDLLDLDTVDFASLLVFIEDVDICHSAVFVVEVLLSFCICREDLHFGV